MVQYTPCNGNLEGAWAEESKWAKLVLAAGARDGPWTTSLELAVNQDGKSRTCAARV